MMRMHIDLKICHFLLFTLSIAEAEKSKNKGETGIHGPSLCRGSTTKQFLFHRVLKKIVKIDVFGASHGNWHFTYSRLEDPKGSVFDNFWGYPTKQKWFSSTPPTWGWTMDASFLLIFGFSSLRNTHSQQKI